MMPHGGFCEPVASTKEHSSALLFVRVLDELSAMIEAFPELRDGSPSNVLPLLEVAVSGASFRTVGNSDCGTNL